MDATAIYDLKGIFILALQNDINETFPGISAGGLHRSRAPTHALNVPFVAIKCRLSVICSSNINPLSWRTEFCLLFSYHQGTLHSKPYFIIRALCLCVARDYHSIIAHRPASNGVSESPSCVCVVCAFGWVGGLQLCNLFFSLLGNRATLQLCSSWVGIFIYSHCL